MIDLLESQVPEDFGESAATPCTPTRGSPPIVTPVDYKRGRVPDIPERAWEPERVQLCAQGLILRENGYRSDEGVLYFVQSKTRVTIPFDDALCDRVREIVAQMREMASTGRIPPPLADSPKCPRCSLVGICLPDETRLLAGPAMRVGCEVPLGRRIPTADDDRGLDVASRDPTTTGITEVGDVQDAEIGDSAIDPDAIPVPELDEAKPLDDYSDNVDPLGAAAPPNAPHRVRRLIPTNDDGRSLYVQEQGAFVGKKGDLLQVRSSHLGKGRSSAGGSGRSSTSGSGRSSRNSNGPASAKGIASAPAGDNSPAEGDEPQTIEARLSELLQLNLFGNVQVSSQALGELCDRQIPVAHFSTGGYFRGLTMGMPSKNVDLRIRQYRAAADPARCLELARAWVRGKILNQRTLLRRNHDAPPRIALDDLRDAADSAARAENLPSLLGIEGNAARTYFGVLPGLLRPRADTGSGAGHGFDFDFTRRNRRPPADPVNALLSYGYAILAKDLAVTCWAVGLDPFLGFFHQPKYGKPALALDVMEEFRPIVVDSVVITAINTGVVEPKDFLRRGPAVALKPEARRRFLQAYERRMDSLVTHPIFGYRISYRRILEVQVRILSRVLLGELPEYVPFVTR